jgi:hypothetical protein
MNQKFIKNILVGGFIALSLQANAAGFNKSVANADGKVMTSSKFYEILAKTKTDQITANFGVPDQMLTLKNTAGETQGVVWVYESAVKKADGLKDARFVIIQGELKYVALSNEA